MAVESLELNIIEKQILHLYLDNPEYLDKGEIVEFITDYGNEFYGILLELSSENFEFISEHILTHAKEYVNINILKAVLDTEYQLEKFEYYIEELSKFNLYENLNSKLKETQREVLKKGDKNLDKIFELHREAGNLIAEIDNGKGFEYKTFEVMLEEHKESLKDNIQNKKQSSGCYLFDSLITDSIPGICMLAGYSGSAKSTTSLYLAITRLIKRLPTVLINTELSFKGMMNNMLSSLIDVPYFDLIGGQETSTTDFNTIVDRYENLQKRHKDKKTFIVYPKNFLSLKDYRKFIIDSRKKMELKDDETLFSIIDLLPMIKEFNVPKKGMNKAESIEVCMDEINEIVLEHNVFNLSTIQLNNERNRRIEIEREEDIEKFRPTLEAIRGSGAFEMRARWVISIFNRHHIVHKNPCSPIIRDLTSKTISLTMLKDNYFGKIGKEIQYLFDHEYKRFVPYEEGGE